MRIEVDRYRDDPSGDLQRLACLLLGVALLSVVGCKSKGRPAAEPSATSTAVPSSTPVETVGVASMDPDGTIVLQLRGVTDDGLVAETLVRYPKGHADYEMILKHLDGLRPGESKFVKPFPPP